MRRTIGTGNVGWYIVGLHRPPRLVLDELLQLVERPVCVLCPLLAPDREPVADTLEVFKSDVASGALRFLHKTLADRVVGVGLKRILRLLRFASA